MNIREVLQYSHDHQIKIDPKQRYIGIFFILFAWLLVSLLSFIFDQCQFFNNALTTEDVIKSPFFALVFFIFLGSSFAFFLFFIKNTHQLKLNSPRLVGARGLIGVSTFVLFLLAKIWPSIIDNTFLFSAEVLFVPFLLRNPLSFMPWFGISVGILGMATLFSFDTTLLSLGTGVAVIAAALLSILVVISGLVIQKDPPLRVAFYQSLIGLIITGLFAFISGIFPGWREALVMFVCGIFYSWAFFLFLDAYFFTEAWIIAMLSFSLVIFAELIKWIHQAIVPTTQTTIACLLIFLGIMLVIFSSYWKRPMKKIL